MSEVKTQMDFIQWLGTDMSIKVLTYLDDPSDLVRVSAVSSSWYHFVIENGLSKQLCLKIYPEISAVVHTIEVDNMIEPASDMHEGGINFEGLKRSHKVYATLAFGLTPKIGSCISKAISASSAGERTLNTLHGDGLESRPLYWSSEGTVDPAVPDTLVYELGSKICLVSEILARPFQARAIRFRMGHTYPMELESVIADDRASNHMFQDNEFIWTYTSPVFPVAKENRMNLFKLPEPVLCIGGLLLVELLDRVHEIEFDELFYICIYCFQVLGRPLSPKFDVKINHPSGKCTLKYCP